MVSRKTFISDAASAMVSQSCVGLACWRLSTAKCSSIRSRIRATSGIWESSWVPTTFMQVVLHDTWKGECHIPDGMVILGSLNSCRHEYQRHPVVNPQKGARNTLC